MSKRLKYQQNFSTPDRPSNIVFAPNVLQNVEIIQKSGGKYRCGRKKFTIFDQASGYISRE